MSDLIIRPTTNQFSYYSYPSVCYVWPHCICCLRLYITFDRTVIVSASFINIFHPLSLSYIRCVPLAWPDPPANRTPSNVIGALLPHMHDDWWRAVWRVTQSNCTRWTRLGSQGRRMTSFQWIPSVTRLFRFRSTGLRLLFPREAASIKGDHILSANNGQMKHLCSTSHDGAWLTAPGVRWTGVTFDRVDHTECLMDQCHTGRG